jgi:hypothetical protein
VVPCEATVCPYEPSPGACALLPENVLAVHVWERWRALGEVVWQVLPLALTPSQAELLCEQLYTLHTYSQQLAQEAESGNAQSGDGRDDGV